MDLRVQVPGQSYFSIDPVLEPLRHTLWGFWIGFARRVACSFPPVATSACPSLIVAQSGGGDGFLFRPSKIPFMNVARRWSPFATASGSVALS